MKNFLTIILLLNFIQAKSQTPSWAWANNAGDISNDYSNAVCTDASGNVYATGTFQGSTITFGSYTLSNTATGTLDIFIVKYDANGNVLWAISEGGTGYDYAYGICTDVNGNVYITGFFGGPSITFGSTILNNDDTSGYYRNVFITKYDVTGNVIWANRASGYAMSFGICTDTDSNVYITGSFGSSSNIIFGSDTLVSKGSYDIFIAKYDAGGNTLWVKNMGGTQSDLGSAICTDSNKNIYITGWFQNRAFFGNDSINGSGNSSIFVAKYDTSGNIIWAKSAVGTPVSGDYNYSNGIIANTEGVYITGSFHTSIIFGDTLANANSNSIFIAKYDTNGNALWGRSPGGTGRDYGNAICTNSSGNVILTGYFASSFLNFGGIPVLNANIGYDDVFVAEYDTSGNALWATGTGGQDNDYGMGICSSIDGSVYLTGYFGSYSVNFGITTLINNGSYDVFLAKLALFATGIEENSSSAWSLFPNPFSDRLNISLTNNTLSEINLYDIASRKILQQKFTNYVSLNTEQLAQGIYIYEVRNKNGMIKQGKVVKD